MLMTELETRDVLRVHNDDNVVVALKDMTAGTECQYEGGSVTLSEDVSRGHKIAIQAIVAGEHIIKYGYSIGYTTTDISVGSWVHSHNLKTALTGEAEYTYNPSYLSGTDDDIPTFMGYKRSSKRAGIRNELWIVNSVGCVNHTAKMLARRCTIEHAGRADDFVAVTHPFGCSQLGDDLSNTKNILSSLTANPNAGGVLLLGLGCENNQLSKMIEDLPDGMSERIRYFNTQQVEDEEEEGMRYIQELLAIMDDDQRTPCPVSMLTVGMKCGGSDGLSGLTANPLVGRMCEKFARYGATVLLTETPEMFGAEQVLMNHAANEDVYDKIQHLVNDFKQYFIDNKQPVYENPSPGNKDGGLTTLEEKSLGAIQKGGNAVVKDVIQYGQKVSATGGITLLQGPGNDAVSSTALAASGANMVLFTTGRGTPLGVPVPTVKIASNSNLATRKAHWIDFDAGQMLRVDKTQQECADELFDLLLDIASGKQTKNEVNEFKEISIWKGGVTL